MQTKNYTLEKHLDEICKEDDGYKVLNSIWILNKENLSKGLNQVSNYYPHYSSHDSSHSMKILDEIQNFLGEDRIKNLGATDTFLILMACLTHDIGMILSYKLLEEEWTKDNFEEKLTWFAENGDGQIKESALLLKNRKTSGFLDDENFEWAIEVRNAVVLLTAEIFRGKHAKISSDYLRGKKDFYELANNFYSEQIPSRFMDLLATVAYLHGESFEKIFDLLEFKANGFKGDFIHPRFIACLLRLGDLLDFDSNRFNEFSIRSIKEIPSTSLLHKQKHASVRHMLVSPTSIEATLDCDSEEVYRVAREWFDMLESEVNKQSREWTNVAPADLTGLPPVISKNSIKILFKGEKTKPELLNLKFTMSQQKIFDILQGGVLYKEPGMAFLREIVQNALDASKIQLWKDINDGLYSVKPENINYQDDIENDIYKQYPINLIIKWKDEKKQILIAECEDYGTGISELDLLRMTNHVGESHKKDEDYKTLLKSMPVWLRPTAAFGVGLQSVFMVNNKFVVETKPQGEDGHKIIFRSAANNNYCSLQKCERKKRGTKIIVEISRDRFPELFGNSFDFNIIGRVDAFSDCGHDDIYIEKIDDYVQKNLGSIKYFTFKYTSINEDNSIKASYHGDEKKFEYDLRENYKIGLVDGGKNLWFSILDKESGSRMDLSFLDSISDRFGDAKLLLRGVEVSDARIIYFLTHYFGYVLDLNNGPSDKIVDLTRERLLPSGKDTVSNIVLRKLLPKYIVPIIHLLKNNINTTSDDVLIIQYFMAILTYRMFKNANKGKREIDEIVIDKELLSKVKVDKKIVSDKNFNQVNLYQFLTAPKIYLVSNGKNKINGEPVCFDNVLKKIENIDDFADNDIAVWNESVFFYYLKFTCTLTNIIEYNGEYKILLLQHSNDNTDKCVGFKKGQDCYLSSNLNYGMSFGRNCLYPIDQYKNIIIKNHWVTGFENIPQYVNSCIFNPFGKYVKFDSFVKDIEKFDKDNVRLYVEKNIKKIVTKSLVEDVIHHSILEGDKKPDEDKVYEDYIELVVDMILASKKYEKNPC